MGDGTSGPVRFSFNPQLRVEFRGATVTPDAGLLLPRELELGDPVHRAHWRRRARAAVASLAIYWLIAGLPPALGHTGGSTGYASIIISGNTIRYTLTLFPSALPTAVAEELAHVRSGRADSRDRLLVHIRDKVTP